MKALPFLAVLLWATSAVAGVVPITSFASDTNSSAAHARADAVDHPVWLGIQYSPAVGDVGRPGRPHAWDAEGTPWIALSAAWPWTAPVEVWAAAGYAHLEYRRAPAAGPIPTMILPLATPLSVDQYMVRGGFDGLIGRGHTVSAAIGPGVGFGQGNARLAGLSESKGALLGEALAHGLGRVQLGAGTRVSAGAAAGYVVEIGHSGDVAWHWELELHIEHAVGGGSRTAP